MQLLTKRLTRVTTILLMFIAQSALAEVEVTAAIKAKHVIVQAMAGHDEIQVSSSDGVHWDTVLSKPLKITSNIKIDTYWPGMVQQYALFLGRCVGGNCAGIPQILYETVFERDVADIRIFWLPGTDIPLAPFGSKNNNYGQEMLQACTELMTPDSSNDLVFNKSLNVTMSAATFIDVDGKNLTPMEVPAPGEEPGSNFHGGDTVSNDTLTVKVRCRAYGPQRAPEPVDLTNLEVFLTTYQGLYSSDDGISRCKKLRILVRATAAEEGPATVRLMTSQNGVLSHTDLDMSTTSMGGGIYEAEAEQWVNVASHTHVEAIAMEMVGGFASGIDSGWKDINLQCGGDAGGGALVLEPHNNDGPIEPGRPGDDRVDIDDLAPLPSPAVPPAPPRPAQSRVISGR